MGGLGESFLVSGVGNVIHTNGSMLGIEHEKAQSQGSHYHKFADKYCGN